MNEELGTAATICVEWGDELHCLSVDTEDWEVIKSGEEIFIDGEGYFYEGKEFGDSWRFKGGIGGELLVTYRGDEDESEGEGYVGTLDEGMIGLHAS